MNVPANEEVADGRKMKRKGKGGLDSSYPFPYVTKTHANLTTYSRILEN